MSEIRWNEATICWNEATIFRHVDERRWREQQEYRRQIWRSRLEFEALIDATNKQEGAADGR